MKKYYIFILRWALGLMAMGILVFPATVYSQYYESYFLYLGNHPKEAQPGWHENVQGITHDINDWFITQKLTLWKIPVSHDLSHDASSHPHITIGEVPELNDKGYDHFGDLTYYQYKGKGYLVIPVEDNNPPCCGAPPVVAVFRPDSTLDYIDHTEMNEKTHFAWAAIDPDGYLYTSQWGIITTFQKYEVEWDTLNNNDTLIVRSKGSLQFSDEYGNELELKNVQGGVFSVSGRLLYVLCGYYEGTHSSDGINVFDTQTWRRIRQSKKGEMPFNYQFHPGWDQYEEPEGITVWNLDDGKAPGILGSLHALLYDTGGDANVYLKHYTEVIYVDGNYTGTEEEGTRDKPFNTVGEANNLAWEGQRIKIQSGTYPESLTFSKRIQILPIGGPVVIGE